MREPRGLNVTKLQVDGNLSAKRSHLMVMTAELTCQTQNCRRRGERFVWSIPNQQRVADREEDGYALERVRNGLHLFPEPDRTLHPDA